MPKTFNSNEYKTPAGKGYIIQLGSKVENVVFTGSQEQEITVNDTSANVSIYLLDIDTTIYVFL